MDQLIQSISAKAGITTDQAAIAIREISDALKKKFPSVLHEEIDNVIDGKNFGEHYKKKFEEIRLKIEETAKTVGSRAEDALDELKQKFNEFLSSKKNPPSA